MKVLCFFKLAQNPDCKIFYFFFRVSHFKGMNENWFIKKNYRLVFEKSDLLGLKKILRLKSNKFFFKT